MKKQKRNNALLLVGMLAISFSSKAKGPGVRAVGGESLVERGNNGQQVRHEEPQPGRTMTWLRNLFSRSKPQQVPAKTVSAASTPSNLLILNHQKPTTSVTIGTLTLEIEDTTLTDQDKVAIEKSGKGGFFSFLHPKPKTTLVAQQIVKVRAELLKDFTPEQKQLFTTILAQGPKDETPIQHINRIKALALAEIAVINGIRDASLYYKNAPIKLFDRKIKIFIAYSKTEKAKKNPDLYKNDYKDRLKLEEQLNNPAITPEGQLLFNQETKKLLNFFYPSQK